MSEAERAKWEARYRASPPSTTPSSLITALDDVLPRRGRALDVAGGAGRLLVILHPTRSNLARHPRPGPEFLLEDGELRGLVPGLETVRYDEGWLDGDQHVARLVARRPGVARLDAPA